MLLLGSFLSSLHAHSPLFFSSAIFVSPPPFFLLPHYYVQWCSLSLSAPKLLFSFPLSPTSCPSLLLSSSVVIYMGNFMIWWSCSKLEGRWVALTTLIYSCNKNQQESTLNAYTHTWHTLKREPHQSRGAIVKWDQWGRDENNSHWMISWENCSTSLLLTCLLFTCLSIILSYSNRGDIVDRGQHSCEVFQYLMCLKIKSVAHTFLHISSAPSSLTLTHAFVFDLLFLFFFFSSSSPSDTPHVCIWFVVIMRVHLWVRHMVSMMRWGWNMRVISPFGRQPWMYATCCPLQPSLILRYFVHMVDYQRSSHISAK